MSTGKGSKSIRKSQQGNDLLPSVGFLNTVIKHKATLGQTVINLGSLTVPPEATAKGFVQPTGGTLSSVDLQRYKNNVIVSSTFRGYMDNPIDYRITGTQQITLDVAAIDGECFTIAIEARPKNAIELVAAQPKVVSYTLPVGETDIPTGPYTINANPNQRVGDFMVIIDRQIMYRNTSNSAPGIGVTGDYQELSGLVRMNVADNANTRDVILVWVGALVDNPQDTQLALIQTLAGQIDAMVPTLAALAGVSETTFQTAPNDPDLIAFATEVLSQGVRITALETAVTRAAVALNNSTGSVAANSVTSGNYLLLTGNSITLPAGVWEVTTFFYCFSGSAGVNGYYGSSGLYGANGANSSTPPASVASLGSVTSVQGFTNYDGNLTAGGDVLMTLIASGGQGQNSTCPPLSTVVTCNASTTIYAVPRIFNPTPSNGFFRVMIQAKRMTLGL